VGNNANMVGFAGTLRMPSGRCRLYAISACI